MPSSREILPPPSRLEATALALEERRDWRNLIRFVERWQELGEATPVARMAQARAFVTLCLMDRATIRLEKLAKIDTCEAEALKLLARCFLMRGWPKKAKGPLQKLLPLSPDDPDVIAMLEQASLEPMTPDDTKESSKEPHELVALAQEHIAFGAFLRAQALIERARRIRPNNPHAADLLWGMAGDYHTTEPMADLVRKWGPEIQLADLPDVPDHTEQTHTSAKPSMAAWDVPEPADKKAFHRLFKGLDEMTESYTDTASAEVTQTAAMANVHDLSGFEDANPEAPTTIAEAEDTQIAMVIRPSGPIADLTEVGRRPNATPIGLTKLVGSARRPRSDFDPGLEEEDDDLIILTGRERETLPPKAGLDAGLPLEPDATTSDVSGRVADILEQVAKDKAREALGELPHVATRDSGNKKKKKRRRPQTGSAAWWLFAIGAILFASAMVIFALAFLQFLLG